MDELREVVNNEDENKFELKKLMIDLNPRVKKFDERDRLI